MTRPTPRLARRIGTAAAAVLALATAGCASKSAAEGDAHADHAAMGHATAGGTVKSDGTLPAGSADVAARLAKSPRHGEYVMVRTGTDSVRAWVSYPERADKAPVVLVVHEIFGLSTWIRGVADQLAADGFIAIAPDLLTGKAAPAPGSDTLTQAVATSTIRTLRSEDVQRQLAALGQYGMSLPAAAKAWGVVGFCWGGTTSFNAAVTSAPGLKGAVVYYGSSPATPMLSSVDVPVLGLYGGADARVNATIAPADSALKAMGKRFDPRIFAGAGHGFLRQQAGPDAAPGANLAATREAWPLTIGFFRSTLR